MSKTTRPDFSMREFRITDYADAFSLWKTSEGVGLDESDTEDAISSFLKRNPGLSFVAIADNEIVGAVLCGHDGRRGYLHHLAVAERWRHKGLGRALTEACLSALGRKGIPKCNIFLFSGNREGKAFWIQNQWRQRNDLKVLQRVTSRDTPKIPRHGA
jgi:ribosomal protein S18 acetylase RimI-like enzyme